MTPTPTPPAEMQREPFLSKSDRGAILQSLHARDSLRKGLTVTCGDGFEVGTEAGDIRKLIASDEAREAYIRTLEKEHRAMRERLEEVDKEIDSIAEEWNWEDVCRANSGIKQLLSSLTLKP